MRVFISSDINSRHNQVTALPFLLDGDTIDYYQGLMKQVPNDWFGLMLVLGQCFDCMSHEPVYLSDTEGKGTFPRHTDYLQEFRTCVIRSRVNSSDLQIDYVVNSRIFEGLSNDAVLRKHIVGVRSQWRSGTQLLKRTWQLVISSRKFRMLPGRRETSKALQVSDLYL